MKKISLLLVLARMMCGLSANATTYTITTAAEWNALAQKMATDSTTLNGDVVYIANDIDFAGDTILPLGYDLVTLFDGELDGNGKTISGYVAEATAQYYGAIATNTGTSTYIHDLTINGTLTSAYSHTGGVVGGVYGTVKNCSYSGTFTGGTTYQGGIAGYVYSGGTVTGCSFSGTLTSSSTYASGIAAYVANGGTVSDCGTSESGSVTGANYVGGAVGYTTGTSTTISGCYNNGTVTGTGSYTGGVVGYAATKVKITGCYNAGKVTASGTYVGGIVGAVTYPILTDCYNSGTVTSTSSSAAYSAGIVAYMATYTNSSTNLYGLSMTNCYNTGTVTGYHVAGIFGFAATNSTASTQGTKFGLVKMYNCYNTSDITTSLGRANGLASTYTPGGTYQGCYNTGNITATSTVTMTSGLFGANSGNQLNKITVYTTVSGCYNTGDVSSSASLCAGVMPSVVKYATVDACYNTGNITLSGSGYCGGVLAYLSSASSTISNCYNAGDVTQTGSSYTGGLAGNTGSTTWSNVFNCGNITGNGQTGGIFGCLGSSSLTNAYNTGTVSAGTYGGGIVGYSTNTSASVSNVYNTGSITGTTSAGPITGGTVTSTISSAYYLSATATGGSYDAAGTSLTYAELASLDLGSSWTAGDNYTYPRITAIADNDYAKAYAAAVIPDDSTDVYTAMTGVFYLGAPDGVTWAADNSVISYDGQMGYFNADYAGGTITMAATSGDVTVTTALVYGVTTGIDDTLSDSDLAAAEIVSETLYNTSGQIVTAPADGQKAIYIVRRVYSDGSVTTAKEVR